MRYGREVRTGLPFEVAVTRVREALAEQGFGVLTEIDVAGTLRAKLGVQASSQVILGACNPQLAHRALQIEPALGLLLPCNVVVRQDEKSTVVAVLEPRLLSTLTDRPELEPIAEDVSRRLDSVLDRLARSSAAVG